MPEADGLASGRGYSGYPSNHLRAVNITCTIRDLNFTEVTFLLGSEILAISDPTISNVTSNRTDVTMYVHKTDVTEWQAVLSITKVTCSHVGTYTCRVARGNGQTNNASATLRVRRKQEDKQSCITSGTSSLDGQRYREDFWNNSRLCCQLVDPQTGQVVSQACGTVYTLPADYCSTSEEDQRYYPFEPCNTWVHCNRDTGNYRFIVSIHLCTSLGHHLASLGINKLTTKPTVVPEVFTVPLAIKRRVARGDAGLFVLPEKQILLTSHSKCCRGVVVTVVAPSNTTGVAPSIRTLHVAETEDGLPLRDVTPVDVHGHVRSVGNDAGVGDVKGQQDLASREKRHFRDVHVSDGARDVHGLTDGCQETLCHL
ncbi:hypothetical protein C0Q70_20996 [Pomacea canaliculata]|uniref:Ig-like domain-containing protein n=1 Tax=Pomacea canaliculata TaxID=400727 RepID=A0A2T7NBA6_POMCA|nr:hypothetical protein C0Q70_20996 [Pomacea canaliculata]